MVKAEFNEDLGIMCFTLRGEITLSTLVRTALSWMRSDDFRPQAGALWDLRSSDWSRVNSEFAHVGPDIIAEINQYRPGHARVAWVVDTATEASLIDSIYATQDWNSTWRAFTSTEAATEWLTESDG